MDFDYTETEKSIPVDFIFSVFEMDSAYLESYSARIL